MTTLQNVLLLFHLVGMAALVGGYLATVTAPRATAAMVWGARFQMLSGLAMVGVAESQKWHLDHGWVGVKLIIAFIVVGLLEVASAKEKKGEAVPGLVHAAGVLAIVNVAVASLWT